MRDYWAGRFIIAFVVIGLIVAAIFGISAGAVWLEEQVGKSWAIVGWCAFVSAIFAAAAASSGD